MNALVVFAGRSITPVALITAVALFVKGYARVGDGFSAGLLAGLAAVISTACEGGAPSAPALTRRSLPLAWMGFAACVATALAPTLAGAPPLVHAPGAGAAPPHAGALELHTVTLFEGGIALLVFGAVAAAVDRLSRLPPSAPKEDA